MIAILIKKGLRKLCGLIAFYSAVFVLSLSLLYGGEYQLVVLGVGTIIALAFIMLAMYLLE